MKTPPDAPLSPVDGPTSNSTIVDKQLIGRRMIREAALFVDRHLSRQPPVQRFFSFMPTLLTRVSPFHFKYHAKSKDWPLVRLDSGDVNAWGRMRVVGELLVIFDETVLFCLLSLMSRYQNEAFESTLVDLSGIAGVTPTAANFTSIWRSIQRLAGTRIDLELTSGSGKKRRCLKEMTGSILSFGDLDRESGIVRIAVNPYFIEMYAESFVTNIDLRFRAGLKNDVSKAFYRFFQGQYDKTLSIDLNRLARSVNLDSQRPPARLRNQVRNALSELKERNYLQDFEITEDNRVHTVKARHTALKIDVPIFGTRHLESG
ncbi:MAG: RepB family plasmid replication initiator protein [Desulfobacterales bacterium]